MQNTPPLIVDDQQHPLQQAILEFRDIGIRQHLPRYKLSVRPIDVAGLHVANSENRDALTDKIFLPQLRTERDL